MGLFSSLFGGTKEVKQPFESNPWKPQQPYLEYGFEQGKGALTDAMKATDKITDFTANMNGGQVQDLNAIQGFGRDTIGGVAQTGINTGLSTVGNFGQAGQNYGQLYSQAGVDPTQGIISNAQAYANDPYLQGQIDSALGDVRKAFDGTVAGINSSATGSGNINSTRAGALEAIALDDAMDRGAAISSQMRGQAYQSGLDRAMTTQQTQFDNQFRANAGLEQSGIGGFTMASNGAALGMGGLESSLAAGDRFQGQAQAEIDGAREKAAADLGLVSSYMGAIGGNYGSNGYQTQIQKTPGLLQTGLGITSSLGGLGWRPFG